MFWFLHRSGVAEVEELGYSLGKEYVSLYKEASKVLSFRYSTGRLSLMSYLVSIVVQGTHIFPIMIQAWRDSQVIYL